MTTTVTMGARGTLVVPTAIRKRLGLADGALLLLEVQDRRLIVREAVAVPAEEYSAERRARFILEDAVDAAGYAQARDLVQRMGLDPDRVAHERPAFTKRPRIS